MSAILVIIAVAGASALSFFIGDHKRERDLDRVWNEGAVALADGHPAALAAVRRARAAEEAETGSCVICGRPTAGQTADERLPRWICPGRCADLWREAEERADRGEFLPTIPGELPGPEPAGAASPAPVFVPGEESHVRPRTEPPLRSPGGQIPELAALDDPGPDSAVAAQPGTQNSEAGRRFDSASGPGRPDGDDLAGLDFLEDEPDLLVWAAQCDHARTVEITIELAALSARLADWQPELPRWAPLELMPA